MELELPSEPSCLEKSWDEEHLVGTRMCCWSFKASLPALATLWDAHSLCPQQLLFCGRRAPQALQGQLEPVRDDVIALNCCSQAGFLKQEFREDLACTPWMCQLPSCQVPESPGSVFISLHLHSISRASVLVKP